MEALVVLSGGQDSATCLAMAIANYGRENVAAISFAYGQRHEVETRYAEALARHYQIDWTLVPIGFLKGMVTSGLLESASDISKNHPQKEDLPASFVPNRNALFLTIAHAYAQAIGADKIYTGVCQTDYSGYPDCRRVFIDGLEQALNVGYQTEVQIITPLMFLTKAETFELAATYDALEIIRTKTLTCYNGEEAIYAWGRGCAECPACKLRIKGWDEYTQNTMEDKIDD